MTYELARKPTGIFLARLGAFLPTPFVAVVVVVVTAAAADAVAVVVTVDDDGDDNDDVAALVVVLHSQDSSRFFQSLSRYLGTRLPIPESNICHLGMAAASAV